MHTSDSLLGRALVALALTVGFYVFAVTVALTLLATPYLIWSSTERVNAQLTIFCVVSGLLILYSVLPRIDKFVAPGPRLTEIDHPELFGLIRQVAKATGQAVPAEVYLVPDLNAWVTSRGGFLGVGSKKVMGLGLPTFEALTMREFAAVIAHEFGHYHHGDVALGPLIYRGRQAIARTLQALEERNNILLIPFSWYGHLFMKLTTAISRRQEYGADALAARVVGGGPLKSGLETIHASASIYEGYWGSEVMPVLVSGKRPQIAEGFRRFSASPRIRELSDALLRGALEAPEDPFDTHPPLAKRIAALEGLPNEGSLAVADSERASSLLGNTETLEADLLAHMIADESQRPQESVQWDSVGEQVWVPIWQHRVDSALEKLAGIRCADAGAVAADPSYLAVRMRLAATSRVTTDEHRYQAAVLFGSALSILLLRRGGTLRLNIGDDPVVTYRETEVRPFLVCRDLEAGTMSASDWIALCERLDIAAVDVTEARSPVPA